VAIHRTFVTPFDRSPFLDLINALDDVIDLMKDPGRRMLRYGVAFTPEMQGMVDRAVRATMPWRDGMPLLGAIERNLDRLSAMSETVRLIPYGCTKFRVSMLPVSERVLALSAIRTPQPSSGK